MDILVSGSQTADLLDVGDRRLSHNTSAEELRGTWVDSQVRTGHKGCKICCMVCTQAVIEFYCALGLEAVDFGTCQMGDHFHA